MLCVQVAGLIARRIVCWVVAREISVQRGERFGLIRFGSRMDTFLPLGTHDKCCGGRSGQRGRNHPGGIPMKSPAMRNSFGKGQRNVGKPPCT